MNAKWCYRMVTLLAGLVLSGCATHSDKRVACQKDVEYGQPNGTSLKLDIYTNKGATNRMPAIIWIHGGSWKAGSKKRCPWFSWRREVRSWLASNTGSSMRQSSRRRCMTVKASSAGCGQMQIDSIWTRSISACWELRRVGIWRRCWGRRRALRKWKEMWVATWSSPVASRRSVPSIRPRIWTY